MKLTDEQSNLVGEWYYYAVRAATQIAGPTGRQWGIPYEEFYDRAVDGLISAARNYDAMRHDACPWFRFMTHCIWGHLRKRDRKKRIAIVYDANMNEIASGGDVQRDIDEYECLEKIFYGFSVRRRKILAMLINDKKNGVEIGKTMGLTRKAISAVRMHVIRGLQS